MKLASLRASVALLIAAAGMPGHGQAAQAPQADSSWDDYVRPARLVTVPDGRALHLFCIGEGSPTIILTAGFGDWAMSWRPVQRAMARTSRTCAWDRPGFGHSGPSPEPVDSGSAAADLASLLAAAGIGPPYVLVGHSLGAYESLLFADRHPGQVAGMVLVDPSFPDQLRRIEAAAPALRAFMGQSFEAATAWARRCREAAAAGTLSLDSADPDRCLAAPSEWPEALRAALRRQWLDPARADTRLSFAASTSSGRNSELAINGERDYGAMPLIVLTAMRGAPPQGVPEEARAQAPIFTVLWRHMHGRLAALSSRGEQRFVAGASHYIQRDRPEAVIAAVEEVVAAARAED